MPAPAPAPDLATLRHHLQDEADAAFLYREMAQAEPDARRADIYRRLAAVEDRHVGLWRQHLAGMGHDGPVPGPTGKARFMAWLARRSGGRLLLPLLLQEEGREVKAYLGLSQGAAQPATRDTALLLARESKAHAEELGRLAGVSGEPWHRTGAGGVLRNVVYGFNDGLTANFGLVAGMLGAQGGGVEVGQHAMLVAGLAGVVADALSMGASGYLAAKSEREVHEHEIALEREEMRLMPDVEREELALLYEAKGIPAAEAAAIAGRVMEDPERALEEKVREELKIGEATSSPMREAWLTGTATAIGALIPVFPFLVLPGRAAIWTSFAIAMVSHFGVGAARSAFTGRGAWRSGLDMFVVGLGVAAVGYLVGEWVVRLL